ncbi:patatin-like phospholipase family protein [Vaginella massiliensis]|uniref:patatin-like phospholipase family protein n=1 Tax=Vaginella massiliensis TaxID=1816680 RepID=UPI000838B2F9|nr:patatin-like phospholipase family protein [Vaginella massiliensis]
MVKFLIAILAFTLPFTTYAQQKKKVGVVLSGGGAKGYAHIGALKKIEEAGVKIDYIGGTSMGAVIGGLYAAGYTPDDMMQIINNLDVNNVLTNDKNRKDIPFFNKTFQEKYILELPFNNFKIRIPQAISSGQGPLDLLSYLLRNVHQTEDFNKLPTPFFCVATDIETGEAKVFRSGYLPQVILASAAYPSLIKPVEINNRVYIDGGVLNNFPADEMKKMGADYIIGVDVEEGELRPKELVNSAVDIIQQIISFNIVKNSTEQKKLADLIIRPDISQYTVTSFSEFMPIYQKGIEAGEEKFEELIEIAKLQNATDNKRNSIYNNDYILIRDVKTSGLEKFTDAYIKARFGIKPPELLNYERILTGVNQLYATGNFSNITYRIEKDKDDHYNLSLAFTENRNRQFLKFGLHYDDLFKTGLLVNFTSKNFLFKNTNLSTDFVFGDFFRYNINFFIDNGYLPSFGISAFMHNFDYGIPISETDNTEVNYDFKNYVNRVYMQSTLREKYAMGVGLEHQYLNFSTRNYIDEQSSFFKRKEDANFYKAYAYFTVDNRNNPNYAQTGTKLEAMFAYFVDSDAEEFENHTQLKTRVETNLPINNFLSFRFTANFGTFFNDKISNVQKYTLGGYVEQSFINYTKFYGLPFGSVVGDNMFTAGVGLQAKILRNHYLNLFANVANVEQQLDDINFLKYQYSGYGISYGYDSPLGPINGYWAYSPQTNKGLFNVSLGFWF